MSIWSIATAAAIWVLIAGSLAVFAWFLIEVVRLVRADTARLDSDDTEDGGADE